MWTLSVEGIQTFLWPIIFIRNRLEEVYLSCKNTHKNTIPDFPIQSTPFLQTHTSKIAIVGPLRPIGYQMASCEISTIFLLFTCHFIVPQDGMQCTLQQHDYVLQNGGVGFGCNWEQLLKVVPFFISKVHWRMATPEMSFWTKINCYTYSTRVCLYM